MSASVKAYFALKMIGDDIESPHMAHARDAILAYGGAARSNVFTRFLLALYGAIPWRGVPTMPVEIMLLPRWFPFHIDKVSYWARTVMVPLLVLQALKPRAANPRGVAIPELFVAPPETVRKWPTGAHQRWAAVKFFGTIDWLLKRAEPFFPASLRRRASQRCGAFRDRAAERRGWSRRNLSRHGERRIDVRCAWLSARPSASHRRAAVDREAARGRRGRGLLPTLLVARLGHRARGPRANGAGDEASAWAARTGLDWVAPLQVLDVKGDWAVQRPNVRPGGWAFQYANPHYPDLDDTAVVAMAMDRADRGGLTKLPTPIRKPSPGRVNGSRACKARTAHGPPSTPTTPTPISITFRSLIMAHCSTRRPLTSRRAAFRCSLSSERRARRARFSSAGSRHSWPIRRRTEAGSAAGA